MKLTLPHSLQSPESTQTTTSGSSSPPTKGADNGGAPEGAKDVGDRVTNEPVVDEATDWDKLSEVEDENLTSDDDTPAGDDTQPTATTEDEDETPASSKPQPKQDGKGKPPADDANKPSTKEPGKDEEAGKQPPSDEDQPPAPPKQETEEEKTARLAKEAEAEKKAFDDLRKYYEIPETDVERLRTEPELVLPELAAKMHQAVFRGMQQWSMQMVPQLLAQQVAVQEANSRTKEAFFGRWPSLKGHDAQVLQVGRMFAQMNPKATPQERLEKVGKLACAALGIDPDPAPDGSGKPPVAARGKKPLARKEGFRPSNPAGSSSAAPAPSDNVFTEMAEEMEREDQG